MRAEFEKLWAEKEKEKSATVEQPGIPGGKEGMTTPEGFRSSVGSSHLDESGYAIDGLNESAPCKLHVPVPSKQGKWRTVEAASGLFLPGRVCHSTDIPSGYAKVQVDNVQPNFEDYELDIPTSEGGVCLKGDIEDRKSVV